MSSSPGVDPGPHGGDAERVAAGLGVETDAILDLSASLNPAAPDVTAVLQRAIEQLGRYPDDATATLALADEMDVDPDRLVLTNGGSEAIALVAGLYPTGWADEDDFSLYRRHLTRLDPGGPRWLSDPHNPTGRLRRHGTEALVRDEAFFVLATGRWTRGVPGAIVVGSLTKAFAVPGLRIGYVLARTADEAELLRARRPRWSVNGLVCAALPALLELADPVGWCRAINELRCDLVALLRGHGLEPEPSDTNYLWIPAAPGLRNLLLDELILIRDGASFGHADAVRIAVPDDAGLNRLETALDRLASRLETRP